MVRRRSGLCRGRECPPSVAFSWSSDASVLARIDAVKAAATSVQEISVKTVEQRYRQIWGDAPAPNRVYSDEETIRAMSRTLLAAFIAELVYYRVRLGLYKHMVISIVGSGGTAKSTMAFLASVGGLMLAGYPRDEAIELVKRGFHRRLETLLDHFEELVETQGYAPVIILDDFSAFVPKYWLHMKMFHVANLFSLLDILKDYTSVTLVTGRAFDAIAKRLREISQYVIVMRQYTIRPGLHLILALYHEIDPYTARPVKIPVGFDVLPPTIRLPSDVWREMLGERREYARELIERLRAGLEEEVPEELLEEEEDEGDEDGLLGETTDSLLDSGERRGGDRRSDGDG